MRRLPALVLAGDTRVWRAALLVAVPLLALLAYYCLRPRDYYTGTNNVETLTYIAEARAGEHVCVPGLEIPKGTGRIRLQLISRTQERPALTLVLTPAGGAPSTSSLPAEAVPTNRISAAIFPVSLPSGPSELPASLCVTAQGLVNWGGTPLPVPPTISPPTGAGHALAGRLSVRYLPPAGSQRSFLSRAGDILSRASLFRPGFVGPWLYALILLLLLPALALASVRCMALASGYGAAGGGRGRMAGALFAIAALNFACWALITPAFQAPDEVDHFAYTQSLVQRGKAPSRDVAAPIARWSSSETLALEDVGFFTDHQVGDTRVPWSARQQDEYRAHAARVHPSTSDGGGNETAATHGALYYAALAPAYALASSSPLAELTLMRLTSALIGALTVLFAFLLVRELAPGRMWPAVLAALLIAYEPMYGFISGAVNNDVGVNAGAAALELLLIMLVRRGPRLALGLLTGALLVALPVVKGTAYSLYPVAGFALLMTVWRHHYRRDAAGFAALALTALLARVLGTEMKTVFRPPTVAAAAAATGVGAASGALSEVTAHPVAYLEYLWEVFLPRLSFMAPHFPPRGLPGFVIFVERGWGAFGWYDVFFPQWVYEVILVAMLATPVLGLLAARVEWGFVRRHLPEAAILLLTPIAVIAGFEAAFFTIGNRPQIAEFGRYAFPAIAPLSILVVASLHAFGRRWALLGGSGLLVAMVFLSYAGQLVTLTGFYA